MTTPTKSLTKSDLRHFTGSEYWYRHPFMRSVLFTDGAKYVADHGGAYWLLDEIVFAQKRIPALAAEAFQLWKLKVNPDKTGILTCENGDCHTVFSQPLDYTDFPLEEITLYFTNQVILLPSEY